MDLGFKQYLVKFTFEIPVRVRANKTQKEDEVEAYYAARDEFCQFNTNEAEIKTEPISQEEYTSRREIISKLHRYS